MTTMSHSKRSEQGLTGDRLVDMDEDGDAMAKAREREEYDYGYDELR